MKIIFKKALLVLSLFGFIFSLQTTAYVEAATGDSLTGLIPCTAKRDANDPSATPSGLNCNTWQEVVEVIQFFINFAFIVATLLATISFAFAGWLYLTSNGNTEQIKRAHKVFLRVVQGFIVLGLAYLLVKTILSGIAYDAYNLLQ